MYFPNPILPSTQQGNRKARGETEKLSSLHSSQIPLRCVLYVVPSAVILKITKVRIMQYACTISFHAMFIHKL